MKNQRTRRERKAIAAAQASPVVWLLRQFAKCGFEASAAQWLSWLSATARPEAKASKDWPTTPNQMGRLFGGLREELAFFGVEVTFRRTGRARLWRVETAQRAALRRHQEENEAAERTRRGEEKALFRSICLAARRRGRKTR